MCYVCCRETRGWCKSFTRTEIFLTLLECVLLVVFIALLVFLILHFIVCSSNVRSHQIILPTTTVKQVIYTTEAPITEATHKSHKHTPSKRRPVNKTVGPGIQCTWKPSVKTTAQTHYYEYGSTTRIKKTKTSKVVPFTAPIFELINDSYSSSDESELDTSTKGIIEYIDGSYSAEHEEVIDNEQPDYSDGEDAEDMYKSIVLALVKIKPPRDITFGCILTIITEYWTVTAASCIEAIEEVDSLDSFVMMEGYGELRHGRSHIVSNVMIHPMYQGANRSYDIVALRSEDSLMKGAGNPVELPNLVDYFMTTIGERFIILGYGPFRTIDKSPLGRSLHKAYVFSLPSRLCPARVGAGEDEGALRHLFGGEAVPHGGCGRGPVCAGALYSRGLPCNYCAGTPLVRGPNPVLFGIMSDNQQCGVACEPNVFVNVADVREWLDFVI